MPPRVITIEICRGEKLSKAFHMPSKHLMVPPLVVPKPTVPTDAKAVCGNKYALATEIGYRQGVLDSRRSGRVAGRAAGIHLHLRCQVPKPISVKKAKKHQILKRQSMIKLCQSRLQTGGRTANNTS